MIEYINEDGDKLKLVNNKLVVEILHLGEYTTKDSPINLNYFAMDMVHDVIEKANKWDDLMNLIGSIHR